MKNTSAFCFTIALLCLALTGCGGEQDGTPKPFISSIFGMRDDIRTIVVSVPQMGGPGCSQRIQDALSKAEGVRSTNPDVANRKISITYEAIKLGIKNLEVIISDAGFDANDTPASQAARDALPAECR